LTFKREIIIFNIGWGKYMDIANNGEWIVDLGAMTCSNVNNNITVAFEKCGRAFIGKIKDLPVQSFNDWVMAKNGNIYLQKVVLEAEDVFMRAYIENDVEINGIPPEIEKEIDEICDTV